MRATSFNREELKKLRVYRQEKREKAKSKNKEKAKSSTKKKLNGYLDPRQIFTQGVYLLYFETRIVYVGMSSDNVMQRIIDHHKEGSKKFDSFKFYPLKGNLGALRKEEKDLIKKFRPKYNKVHNTPKRLRQVRG